jgi:hypothetical protein
MRAFFVFTPVAIVLFAGSPALAECYECKEIECSGRQIECGHKDPLAKADCEVRKEKWKLNCEAKKGACQAAEKAF